MSTGRRESGRKTGPACDYWFARLSCRRSLHFLFLLCMSAFFIIHPVVRRKKKGHPLKTGLKRIFVSVGVAGTLFRKLRHGLLFWHKFGVVFRLTEMINPTARSHACSLS
ncbi:unnamed protein product, partial [Pylaiella littoralis]